MIYIYSGENTFQSFSNAKAKVQELGAKLNAEIKSIDAETVVEISHLQQEIEGLGLFSQTSVILLKRGLSNKKIIEYLLQEYETLKNFEIVIWQDSKADSKLRIVKQVLADKQLYDHSLLRPQEVQYWLQKEFKNIGLNISSKVPQFIVERLGSDQWAITNELKKINIFTSINNKKEISQPELNLLMGYNVKGDLWKFLDYVGMRERVNAISEYKKIVRYENNVQLIYSMIEREFRLIYQVKYCKNKGLRFDTLKLAPFVLTKTLKKSERYSLLEIEKFLENLIDMDLMVKTGILEEEMSLTLFLSKL